MAFLRNSTVNLLNLHYVIHTFALSGGGAFYSAYLLKAGVKVPGVLAALGFLLLGRFAFRPLIVPLGVRLGLRTMVIAGTLVSALQYPVLAEVDGPGPMLIALVLVSALGSTIYWTTYHAYFAALGDDEHRAKQIGVREAGAAVLGTASPLLAGWLLVAFGPRVAFGVTAIVVALAALPLLATPRVAVARQAPGIVRAAMPGTLLFMADGWIAAGALFAWHIALFLSLDENVLAYGGALALAAVVGAISGLVLGRQIDAGHGKRAVAFAFGLVACLVMLRAAAAGNAALVVVANALGAFGACLYVPTLMTAIYTSAKRSPCMLRFHVTTEGGWDIGGACGLFMAAALTALDVPLAVVILLSLIGLAANALMLRRFYDGHAPGSRRLKAAADD